MAEAQPSASPPAAALQRVSMLWISEAGSRMMRQVSENMGAQLQNSLNQTGTALTSGPAAGLAAAYSLAFAEVQTSLAGAVEEQQELNKETSKGEELAKSLGKVWKGLSGTFKFVKDAMKSVLVPAAEDQKWEDLFIARTGKADVGTAMFEKYQKQALATGQKPEDSFQSALTFFGATKNTEQIDKLMDSSTKLSMLSPKEKGIKDTSDAVMSAYRGKSDDLAGMLGMSKEELTKAFPKMEAMGKAGDMSGFIAGLDSVMAKAGMTQTALQTMMDSPAIQWQTAVGNFNNTLAAMGEGALQVFSPLLTMLNEAFASGTFQPLIEGLVLGFALVAQAISFVVQTFMQFWGTLSTTLPYILPIVFGIAAGFLFYQAVLGAVSLATKIAAAAQAFFSAILAANPIVLVISAIVALVVAFLGLIAALQPVREFMASMFQSIGRVVASFVGFIIDLWTGFVNGIIDAVNFLLSAVNSVVNAIGKFIGLEAEVDLHLEHLDTSQFKQDAQNVITDGMDATADWVGNLSMDDLQQKFGIGGKPGGGEDPLSQWNQEHPPVTAPLPPATPKIPAAPAAPAMPAVPAAPLPANVDRVGSVGEIEENVEVSSDDLKLMRELAEIQAIQNFVELTPTVQVTTGNINSGADLDTIINRIGQKLNEEFVSTAQGVYA